MTPRYWNKAVRALAATDPVMARLIAAYPGERLRSRDDPFGTLARSIVGQQISVKAADTLWRRLEAALGGVVLPGALARATAETLLGAGMSRQKAAYLLDLGQRSHGGGFQTAHWRALDDDAVVAELTSARGIGRWTAEMVLIFALLRPDVLPLDDIGLRRAVANHYGRDYPIARDEVRTIAEPWRPWRTVATWYLWRSLDPLPVSY
jgi:DNA-3-methyladenine glycosylase II